MTLTKEPEKLGSSLFSPTFPPKILHGLARNQACAVTDCRLRTLTKELPSQSPDCAKLHFETCLCRSTWLCINLNFCSSFEKKLFSELHQADRNKRKLKHLFSF